MQTQDRNLRLSPSGETSVRTASSPQVGNGPWYSQTSSPAFLMGSNLFIMMKPLSKNVWSVFFLRKFTQSWRHFLWLRIQLMRKSPKCQAFRVKCLAQRHQTNEGKSQNWKWKASQTHRKIMDGYRLSLQFFWLPKVQVDSAHCQIDWLKHHC